MLQMLEKGFYWVGNRIYGPDLRYRADQPQCRLFILSSLSVHTYLIWIPGMQETYLRQLHPLNSFCPFTLFSFVENQDLDLESCSWFHKI